MRVDILVEPGADNRLLIAHLVGARHKQGGRMASTLDDLSKLLKNFIFSDRNDRPASCASGICACRQGPN